MSIIKGILSNGLANVVQKLVRIADQLLLVPFFLTYWGAAMYGEWLTLTIIPSVLAFSDLGFGSAVSNSFVLAYAAGDKQKAANLRKTGFYIISFSILLGFVITAIAMGICVNMHVFDKSQINAVDAMYAVVFMMVSRLLTFYTQLVEGFFRGARKAAIGSLLGSGNYLINIIVGFIVLILGYGVAVFAFSQFIVSIVYIVVYSAIGVRLVNFEGFTGHVLKRDIIDITKKGMGYLMSPIWQSVYFQGTTFVVRLTLGPENVAIFNTVRTACRSVNQLFSIINASIFPDLQYEYGQGHLQTVHKYFRMAVFMSMIIGFCGFIFLIFFGLNLFDWWTNSVLVVPHDVWNVFMIGVLLNAVWWTSVVSYRMTNQPYHFAIASTVMAFVSVGLTYLFSLYFGLFGATIGCTLFELVMAIYVLPDSCIRLGMKPTDLFLNIRSDFKGFLCKIKKYHYGRTKK